MSKQQSPRDRQLHYLSNSKWELTSDQLIGDLGDEALSVFPRTAAAANDDADAGTEASHHNRRQAADEVIIRGPKRGADAARDELLELYQWTIDNSHTATVSVAQSQIPSLIGAGGREMDALRTTTGAQIDVPNAREVSDASRRAEIKIKGKKLLEQKAKTFDETVVRTIEVDKKHHKALIGAGGANIRDIVINAGGPDDRRELARMVRFPRAESEENTIRVEGSAAIVDKIVSSIETLVKNRESQVTEVLEVAPEKHRLLIGRGGESRRNLESQFSVTVDVPKQTATGAARSQVKIIGQPQDVEKAKEHIISMIKEQEGETVQVPRRLHHAIAENGQFFRRLRNDLRVTVDHAGQQPPPRPTTAGASNIRASGNAPLITDDPSDSKDTHSWQIVDNLPASDDGENGEIPWILRSNNSENVAKAKALLEKAMEEKSKPSSTGYLILPDPKLYRFVVGPGGSQINTIRKKTGTKVQVPRGGDGNEAIEIVDSREGVEQARDIILELQSLEKSTLCRRCKSLFEQNPFSHETKNILFDVDLNECDHRCDFCEALKDVDSRKKFPSHISFYGTNLNLPDDTRLITLSGRAPGRFDKFELSYDTDDCSWAYESSIWPPNPLSVDISPVKKAISHCKDHHGSHCNTTWQEVLPGLMVFNCNSRNLEPASKDTVYVALSYVWGQVARNPESKVFPETIEDAIAVTKQLGYTYIWVDQLCIDQDAQSEQKKAQIRQMDRIYQFADLTIVAMAGNDSSYGLPGVEKRARKRQRRFKNGGFEYTERMEAHWMLHSNSKWSSRAWTYQEWAFSRRALVFTDIEVRFCCCLPWVQHHREIYSFDLQPDSSSYVHKFTRPLNFATSRKNPWSFEDVLNDGLRKSISFTRDRLDSLSGILRSFEDIEQPVHHLHGIPILPPYRHDTGHDEDDEDDEDEDDEDDEDEDDEDGDNSDNNHDGDDDDDDDDDMNWDSSEVISLDRSTMDGFVVGLCWQDNYTRIPLFSER